MGIGGYMFDDGGIQYYQQYGQFEFLMSEQEKDKMAIMAKSEGNGDYKLPASGVTMARCYRIIDLGSQETSFKGQSTGMKRKVLFVWELLGDEMMDDGRPFTIQKKYTLSLHENSALFAHLNSWRGTPFTDQDLLGFDITKVLGAYCLLNIVHTKDVEKTFANIDAIMPVMKGMNKPEGINPLVKFEIENPDMEVFKILPEKVKAMIMAAPEWNNNESSQSSNAIDDEDVPF